MLPQDREITQAPRPAMREPVKPLTDAQRRYDVAIQSCRIVLGTGSAGTGKTWFAAMRAAEALKAGEIEKIVITRPAVEVDEKLGFLPGELEEKYEPYIRPVRDAFEESFGAGHLEYLLRKKIIEPRPLGLLRGATLKNCWVIGDEMQNATRGQMKMLLTRIGENAKFLLNGDPRQSDIGGEAGLEDAVRRLSRIKTVAHIRFTTDDVVRDALCREILLAYDEA